MTRDDLGCIMGALLAMERTECIWLAIFANGSNNKMDQLSQRQVQDQPEEVLVALRRLAVEVARLDVQAGLEERSQNDLLPPHAGSDFDRANHDHAQGTRYGSQMAQSRFVWKCRNHRIRRFARSIL